MPIADICHREAVVMGPELPVSEAAKLMAHHHIEAVVVVEERGGKRFPLGMLSDREIVTQVIAREMDVHAVPVREVMATDMLKAQSHDGIWDTLQRMRSQRARHVLVVDDEGALVGILSLEDLLDLLSEELMILARLVSRG